MPVNTPSAGTQMSVVLVMQGTYRTIRTTVDHLHRQTQRDKLELVLVVPSREALQGVDEALRGFGAVQVVEVGAVTSIAAANAEGIRRATTSVVALAEDHSFPDPDWAEKLIQAHRAPWAAVGPAVRNANPATAVSWADFYIGYGPWMDPLPSGPLDHLPGHNSSYKRDCLLAYGHRLDDMLEAETLLHWDLRARGHTLYLEAGARTAHVNFSRLSSWLHAQYHNGRVFAGTRIETMSPSMRLLYVVSAPLIPLVRLRRIYGEVCRPGRSRARFFKVLPVLLFGLAVDGLGQLVGHVAGVGASREKLARFEFNRFQHLSPRDEGVFPT